MSASYEELEAELNERLRRPNWRRNLDLAPNEFVKRSDVSPTSSQESTT